ncbi:ATP12 family chaperone protein [Pseudohoeflea coraliihabitans]|uniref:ATPase n=1 Tax=Pseudohoeflea coraliihabitans TaxID=2860393 RepID=A0ABS6WRH2_9HYPH|nr:ATP12 family protein [Pseudohoeflea sp. DP4N28-3]MBW3098531.1 ATPase [Pseudohoeflea sp. DP4N28-3]
MRDLLSDLENGAPPDHDPVGQTRAAMQKALPRRFYETVTIEALAEGFFIKLDGNILRTPARGAFQLPSRAVAEAVAAEWEAQTERIDPASMPLTRLLNTALDGVEHSKDAVRQEILAFAGTDLLCYRAASPQGLVDRQAEAWDPFLDWMRDTHHARFVLAEGVMHVDQPDESLSIVAGLLAAYNSALMLAALHVVTGITGSAILALALTQRVADADSVWAAAHVDEDWNIGLWGEDGEAAERRAARRQDFDAAALLIRAVTT